MVATKPTRNDKVKQAIERIDQHLQELAEEMAQGKSERLVQYLNFCAQFHRYSFGNLMLAFSQFPTLTRIAGVKQWNKLGRHVKAGEKGIMILAPMPVKRRRGREESESPEEEAEEESTILLFKPVYVFDESQTEGSELPELISASGDVVACYPALKEAVEAAGIVVEYVEVIAELPGAEGLSLGGCIKVAYQEAPAEEFRVLVHEFAHELLNKTAEREAHTVRETEADAVAYVVCRHFGVTCDTADYLLLHDSNPKLLLERLERVRQTANHIITTIADSDISED